MRTFLKGFARAVLGELSIAVWWILFFSAYVLFIDGFKTFTVWQRVAVGVTFGGCASLVHILWLWIREFRRLRLEDWKVLDLLEVDGKKPGYVNIERRIVALRLGSGHLEVLPPEIHNLQHLNRLSLQNNQLKTFPAQISDLKRLTILDLHNNHLVELDPAIGNLTGLEGLNLNNNQLKTLPSEIGNLKHLRGFDLSGNQLEALPKEIGDLESLRMLDLRNNQLTTLAPELIALIEAGCVVRLEGNPLDRDS